jgi:lipopolysaccharide/colanic/teichoic acid biosynthesis glycosyltransferase
MSLRLQRGLKRLVDLLIAAGLLVVLAPVLAVVAIAVKRSSPGPAIFRQERAGKGGKTFTIYKYRTMSEGSYRPGQAAHAYAGDPRIGRVGAFLRKWSLDELPQLVNVLNGDMSLVGPRPDLPHHVEKYTASQRRRLEVRPGITGWAQVKGRSSLSWDDRIALDLEYLEGWTLLRDLEVVARTVKVILGGRGTAVTKDLKDMGWTGKTDRPS